MGRNQRPRNTMKKKKKIVRSKDSVYGDVWEMKLTKGGRLHLTLTVSIILSSRSSRDMVISLADKDEVGE